MCLTIPAKIKEMDGANAIVLIGELEKKINISLISDLKINDWVLYINNIAIKKYRKMKREKFWIYCKRLTIWWILKNWLTLLKVLLSRVKQGI